MRPILFSIGPFNVYGYGLMLATAFIVASYLMTEEFRRKRLDPNMANTITLIALFCGVAGSKLLYLLEHWNAFVADPVGMALSPGGLTFYGGFILAAVAIAVYVRRKGIPFLQIADSTSPGLMIGYGIARIGCHLAGDGDYGFPTTLPWGTDYSHGTFPPSAAFRSFPEIARQFPNGIVPDTTPCHPTPIYEFILCAILFVVLWRMRKTDRPNGMLFMMYLILTGIERLAVEFFRLNPRVAFGLTEAQLISIALIIIGAAGWSRMRKRMSPAPHAQR
jgi:phosphatidylglycerol:prolipoprotein diacylglycerol transferase